MLKSKMLKEKDTVLQLKEISGFQLSVTGNIDFCGHNTIFYLSSHQGVLHNFKRNSQKFISIRQENEVTAISFGTNSNVAVAFKGQEPAIVILNMKNPIRRVLPASGVKSEYFVSIGFTEDNERLGAQGAGPDWAFVLWQWEKKLLQCIFQPFRMELGAEIHKFSFNPNSYRDITLVGRFFLRFYCLKDGPCKKEAAIHEKERSKLTFHSAQWVRDLQRTLISTSDGNILVYENNILKQQVSVVKELSRLEKSLDLDDKNISCLLLTEEGIVCSYGHTSVLYFRKNFQLEKVYQIPESSTDSGIIQLAMNKQKDRLVVATKDGRILALCEDPSKDKVCSASFKVVQHYQHTEKVTCVSTSKLVSLQASCSPSTIILRDLTTKKSILRNELQMDPISVSLHPLGTSVAIGFQDCAKIYTILVDRLFEEKHFDSVENAQVLFSPGGHLIAVTSNSTISLFYSIGFKELLSYDLHKSKVNSLLWRDDYNLFSSDEDGVLIQWDVAQKKSSWIYCVADATVLCLALQDAKRLDCVLYVACSDCKVRQVKEGSWLNETISTRSPVTAMVMRESLLIVGTQRGRIVGFQVSPIAVSFEYECHLGSVLHLTVLNDSVTVVSVGIDGKISTWRPEGTDESGDLPSRQQVLVSIQEQENTVQQIDELERELRDLVHATEEGRKRNEEAQSKRQAEVEEEQDEIKASLENTANALQKELDEILATTKREFETEEADILAEIENNEKDFENKMANERGNMRRVAEQRKKMEIELLIKTNKKLEQRKHDVDAVRDRCSHHQAKLEELRIVLEKEMEKQRQINEEKESIQIPKRVEQNIGDHDEIHWEAHPEFTAKKKECMENIKNLETELEFEKECCKLLDNELKEKVKQYSDLKAREDEYKRLLHRAENDISKLDEIQLLKDNMSQHLEQEIEELSIPADPTIEKYKKILENRKNTLMETREKRERIEEEHRDLSNQLSAKERQEVVLTERLESTEKSVKNTMSQLQGVRLLIEQYRAEFLACVQDIESGSALRWAILKLYEKRVLKCSKKEANKFAGDTDLYSRFCNQRDHIESLMNVVLNRTTLLQDTFKENYIKLAKENSDWTAFLEDIKADVEQKRARISALEHALGLDRHQFASNSAEARRRLKEAASTFLEVKNAEEVEVTKRLDLIEAQRKEIARLHGILSVEEKGKIVRRRVAQKQAAADST